jgi:hypothetical protein
VDGLQFAAFLLATANRIADGKSNKKLLNDKFEKEF